MGVKMMRWPPWPPVSSRKYEVKIVIKKVKGVKCDYGSEKRRLVVEVKWKGQKSIGLGPLRKSVKSNFTEEGGFCGDGVYEWNEEFKNLCNFSAYKDSFLYPWEVAFSVFTGLNQEPRNTVLVGTATVNLAEFVSAAIEKDLELNVPLVVLRSNTEGNSLLCLSLRLMELVTVQEPPQAVPTLIQPAPASPSSEEAQLPWRDEPSGLKASLGKVKIFREKKKVYHDEESSDGKNCVRGEDGEYNYPFDTDSLDDDSESESEQSNGDPTTRLPLDYGTLAHANFAGGLSTISNAEDDGWIFYNNRKLDVAPIHVGESTGAVYENSLKQSSKRRILSWKKRALNFRFAKTKVKGEPLLKKDYGDSGGDDIDFDRRQLSSSDESSLGWNKSEDGSTTSRSSFSEFGEDHFAIGSWELKEMISRDGHMKLQAQVFFASIDQRSERAAGESACTALVAVIANWLQSNPYEMPIKSEFDRLIRDGSLEWRNLCENEDYKQQFPDKHFDLETVIQAEIRPFSVIAEKSFIGFFHPEGLEGGDFDFLQGAMSFDSIWEEISHNGSNCPANRDPMIYIVSWNDHFFVLKVEQDAYYIIDTLGERLYEGCNQAYILKFNKDTTIQRLPIETKESDNKLESDKVQPGNSKEKNSAKKILQSSPNEAGKSQMEEEIVCKGKESCKEYIKRFLAAIPIRELQADIKKGLMASTPIHHRLQIEFHYTQLTQSAAKYSSKDDLALTVVI